MATQIQIRRDTNANWVVANPVLADGEPSYDTTENEIRVGDGVRVWTDLDPIGGAGGGSGGLYVVTSYLMLRPDVSGPIIWNGGVVRPVNMIAGDVWLSDGTPVEGGDVTAPTIPAGLVASAITHNSFTLTWAASTDAVGVTGYEVDVDGVSAATTVGSAVSTSITSLTGETTYAVRVRAKDAALNWSDWSDPLSVTTTVVPEGTDITPPTVPTGLASSDITTNTFTVSWTASTDAVGVTGYEVEVNGVVLASPTATTANITGRTPSTAYSVRVRAKDAALNWSAWTAALPVNTTAAGFTEHNVFGSSDYPWAMTTYTNPSPITLATYFYTYGGTVTGWKVVGGRLFVPAGSALIGQNAEFYLFTPAAGVAPNLATPAQTKAAVLAQGWNNVYFDAKTVVTAGQNWMIGFRVTSANTYMAFSPLTDSAFVASLAGSPMVWAETSSMPSSRRNWLREGTGATAGADWVFAWGIDAIVESA